MKATLHIEIDCALIAASMRLRKASRNVIKLREQLAITEALFNTLRSLGEPTYATRDLLAEIQEQVSSAEAEELEAEQLWEEAADEADS